MTAPACAIRITRHGGVTVTGAWIVSQSVDVVLVDLDVNDEIAGAYSRMLTRYGRKFLPGVSIGSPSCASWTNVYFPDYANWRVYAAGWGGLFRIHVCLVSPSVEE